MPMIQTQTKQMMQFLPTPPSEEGKCVERKKKGERDKERTRRKDAVNQGIWSLSIELRLQRFEFFEKCKPSAKVQTYSFAYSKIQCCVLCQ